MKKIIVFSVAISVSVLFQELANPSINTEFLSVVATMFSVFFGFYITSFAVFATSKYLWKLYKIENGSDNRRTLLDDLLAVFNFSTKLLIFTLIYLLVTYVSLLNMVDSITQRIFLDLLWASIMLNIFYLLDSVSVFVKVTRKSAMTGDDK